MTPERWQQLKQIFQSALERNPAERSAFLNQACAGDHALRSEVESLISSHDQAADSIELMAGEAATEMLANDRALIGKQIGHYQVLSLIGRGGMGEVFLAQDTNLGRKVALKFLPAHFTSDQERVRRFRQEARAASNLNHPNILTIYEISSEDGTHFMAMEYVEGETLRQRLASARMKLTDALDVALQVASALAAAHEAGIVHRDIKPENIVVRRDGYAKVLDFGLAKLTERAPASSDSRWPTLVKVETNPGVVMGTVHYMSPEQARGLEVDARTDIFSLGVVLYEMLAGERPFHGDSAVETMSAILKEDPPDLSQTNQAISPALERIVRHCLEKNPAHRFQSASDLAFDLESVSGTSSKSVERATPVAAEPVRAKRRFLPALLAAGIVLLVLGSVIGYLAGRRAGVSAPPTFHQLTFRRGLVWSARFAPDGQTVVFGAALEGNPVQIYSTRPEGLESRPLGLPDGSVLAVSSAGEIAVSLNARPFGATFTVGTLARVPLTGGAPRPVLEDVSFADWSPDGKNLAVVHRVGNRWRLEYPVGKVLYETEGHISCPRFSPKGDLIAFMDHPLPMDDRGTVAVVDVAGNKRTLTKEASSERGLAWSADGEEIWFSAWFTTTGDSRRTLQAVTPAGRQRVLLTAPGDLMLQDISRVGRVLLTRGNSVGSSIIGVAPGETKERDLTWLDSSELVDVTADGKTILFVETSYAVGDSYGVYLRQTDGSPAVRLGDGMAKALSPDGKWVLAGLQANPSPILLLPTGVGEPRQLTHDGIHHLGAQWFPDGRRIIFLGIEPGHGQRSYVQDLEGGAARPLTPEGTAACCPSPDGNFVIIRSADGQVALYSMESGEARPLLGLEKSDGIIRWSADNHSLYVCSVGQPTVKVYRVELATGRRELWKELTPPDPVGNIGVRRVVMTPDARAYFYSYYHDLSDLYLVEGLK